MNNKQKRIAVSALALALSVAQLPSAFAADSSQLSSPTAGSTQPSAPPDDKGAPPDSKGAPPDDKGAPPQAVSFSDVSSQSWYAKYVDFVSGIGVMTGANGKFNPNTSITRADFVEALHQAARTPEVTTKASFTDVATNSKYASAIAWAEKNGIATGSTDSKFEPNASLTREMAMTFIYRALSSLQLTPDKTTEDSLAAFSDKSKISSWATEAMNTLAHMGIISGTDQKTINPKSALTNAEVAAILYRTLSGSTPNGGMGGTPPGSQQASNGTAVTTISTEGSYSDTTYTSTNNDENALRVDGVAATLDGITVNKLAGTSSSTDNGDFYGMNAGLLALNGAIVKINNATINTSAQNGNGIFSYGKGTSVTINDSKIRTTADNSGGIQTTGSGTTYANNLDVVTNGKSAAAIRSDRGGGTVVVNGGSYESNGTGSPAVYSTAGIKVNNATLTAHNSEAIVVEGDNSVVLTNSNVTGSMVGTYNDGTENLQNVMLYQSMSGDAEEGNALFSMTGGSLTAKAGDMFYVTNTHANINLSGVNVQLANDTLLKVSGNSSTRGWGKAGANGATVTFTATDQTLTGNIICDKISSLGFSLEKTSSFTGGINTDGQAGKVNVSIGNGAVWSLTSDSYVTTLANNGTIQFNGHTIYLADGTKLTN